MAQLTLLDSALSSADDTLSPADDTVGQLPLFVLPPSKPRLVRAGGMASSNIGEAGESLFEGYCRAWELPFWKAGRGQPGADYFVNEWGVNVKATASIHRDGRMHFQAGSGKRFIDYAGTGVDLFAFVYVGLEDDHFGRSLLMTADAVFHRWRGRTAPIRPIEVHRTPVLDVLTKPRK